MFSILTYDYRVVSSEISGGEFPEIYSNLSGNFLKFVNYRCHSAVCFQVQHCKVHDTVK